MKNNKLEKGKWVRWENNNQLNIGYIVDMPTTNRDGRNIYPIQLINGLKTAVGGDKLTIIPHIRKWKVSPKKIKEFKREIENFNSKEKEGLVSEQENGKLMNQYKNRIQELETALKNEKGRVIELEKENESLKTNVPDVAKDDSKEIVGEITQTLKSVLSKALSGANTLEIVSSITNAVFEINGI